MYRKTHKINSIGLRPKHRP